jgi:hypothetical protein
MVWQELRDSAMSAEQIENCDEPEFSDSQLRDALKRVGRDARQATFKTGMSIVVLKGQKLVRVYEDGREVAVQSLDQPAHVAGH